MSDSPPTDPTTSLRLGATWTPQSTTFAVTSRHADRVELCLFDSTERETRVAMRRDADDVWTVTLAGLPAGQRYGYRAHGPYAPSDGHRFNAAKLLSDPSALAIAGSHVWDDALLGYETAAGADGGVPDARDTAPLVPKCVVVDPSFDWRSDAAPRTPWHDTVVYECHVRGMTKLHPQVSPELRGTYAGLASEPVLDHLTALGVTAVELLPVHHAAIDRRLALLGLTNYWGYNSIGFCAPDSRYAVHNGGGQVREFKEMVRRFHAAGIEVLLDVVYNHTAEGNHLGPTLGPRGLDHALWYRLDPRDRSRCVDWTGTGNTVNVSEPAVRRVIVESLRYWVTDMHVDGFRFDLAPVLGRDPEQFTADAAFFEALRADPVFAGVKLIAEPWDLGPRGYRLGGFPSGWSEWNDRYRDTVRRFWAGMPGHVAELASRISGSADILGERRSPAAGVNFVTCHDGFTLADLVSYERKHNEMNGEGNRDGRDTNLSRNWGAEGPAESGRVRRLRERAQRNFLATLAFSAGVPMISHGDELGRTQAGNNNAYCQDGPLTWVDWDLDAGRAALLAFARTVFGIRREYRSLRRAGWFDPAGAEIVWLRPDGSLMAEADWHDGASHALAIRLAGAAAGEGDLLLLLNGGGRARSFALPRESAWTLVLSTHHTVPGRLADEPITVPPHTLVLLRTA